MLDEERDIMDEELAEEADPSDDSGIDLGEEEDLLSGEEEGGLTLSYSGAKGLDE